MKMSKKIDAGAIEFLKNKVYLGAYDYHPQNTDDLVYFTVEDALPYNAFHLDFGPLHIGHLYRFAVALHNILNDPANHDKAVVCYSSTGPKERANAACILCCYMVLVQSWSPHQVLHPICQLENPLALFRDAGYSQADFELTIQDIIYGVWRAKERGMIDITNFNLEEYETYERVDQGDFNVVSKDFIAFASPKQSKPGAPLNQPFKKVLEYFCDNDVQLVVRLNSHLYDKNEFENRGIKHIDMIFDDGTCPTLDFVQKFIGAAETIISQGGKIAVHCKAGLGRTGCLIGAHLIYTHGFTANECIGYMRMIRPGMVVGPQQHWLYLHQNEFRDWRHTMVIDDVPDESIGGLFPLISIDKFKARNKKLAASAQLKASLNGVQAEYDDDQADTSFTPIRRRKFSGQLKSAHKAVPMESPGQPRKYRAAGSKAASSNSQAPNSSPGGAHLNSDEDATYQSYQHHYSSPERHHQDQQQQYNDENAYNPSPVRPSSKSGNVETETYSALRAIANSSNGSPVQITKTKTTTTTTTTISSSPPPSADSSAFLKLPKQRISSSKSKQRLSSGNEKFIGNPGIRKVSPSSASKRFSSNM